MRRSKILAFDLSYKCTGWAYLVGGNYIDGDHFSMQGWESGKAITHLMDEASRILKLYQAKPGVDLIAVENASFQQGAAREMFFDLLAGMKIVGWQTGLPVEKIAVSTVKLALAGHGHADKTMMIEAAAKLGMPTTGNETPDADMADAIGVGLAAMRKAV